MDNVILAAIVILLGMLVVWIFVISQEGRRTRDESRRIADQSTLFNSNDQARALCRAVHILRPSARAGVDFVIRTDREKGKPFLADWQSTDPRPTTDELDAALAEVMQHGFGEDYVDLRRAAYPDIGDQLDAAYKARHGDSSELEAIDREIRQIKEKYPKPESC